MDQTIIGLYTLTPNRQNINTSSSMMHSKLIRSQLEKTTTTKNKEIPKNTFFSCNDGDAPSDQKW